MPMQWTDADFDAMSWHDNHVHAIRVEVANEDHGTGTLQLDLDYIVEWLPPGADGFRFRVAPATLTFFEIFGLRIEVDWAAATAGMTPFSIGRISRQKIEGATGSTRWRWTIEVNWPQGAITFEGEGFRQELRAEPIVTPSQSLSADDREPVEPKETS